MSLADTFRRTCSVARLIRVVQAMRCSHTIQMAAQGAKRPLGSAGAPRTSQRTKAPLMGRAGRFKPGARYRRAAQG